MRGWQDHQAFRGVAVAYAFWQYDLFPYIKGAKCDLRTLQNNDLSRKRLGSLRRGEVAVHVPSYGRSFAPFYIERDDRKGRAYCDVLALREEEYRAAQRALHERFRVVVRSEIGFARNGLPVYKPETRT